MGMPWGPKEAPQAGSGSHILAVFKKALPTSWTSISNRTRSKGSVSEATASRHNIKPLVFNVAPTELCDPLQDPSNSNCPKLLIVGLAAIAESMGWNGRNGRSIRTANKTPQTRALFLRPRGMKDLGCCSIRRFILLESTDRKIVVLENRDLNPTLSKRKPI